MSDNKSNHLPGFLAEASISKPFDHDHRVSLNSDSYVKSVFDLIYPLYEEEHGGCIWECTKRMCYPIMCPG